MILEFLMSNIILVSIILYFLGAVAYYSIIYPIAYEKPLNEMKITDIYIDFLTILFWLPLLLLIPIRMMLSFVFWIPLKMIAGNKKREE